MTAILPQGLINATATIEQYAFDDSDLYVTNSDVLRRLWKVYAVQSDVTLDNASTRSRNLFWRVWSSSKLIRTITSGRLTSLWQRCSQEFDLTPIGDQFTRSQEPTAQEFPAPRQARNRSSSLSPTSGPGPNLERSPRAGQNIGPSLQDFRFPAAVGESHSNSRFPPVEYTTEPGRQIPDDTSGSASHDTSESSLRQSLTRTTSGGRPRLPVLANAGKARTRPQIPRRKSSSQKSPLTLNAPKSPKTAHEASGKGSSSQEPGTTRVERLTTQDPPPGLPKVPSTTSGSTFILPSASSWQSVDSTSENPPLAATAPPIPPSDLLVDRGFREKFMENQKKMTSSSNLAGLNRIKKTGSIVRFADEIPQDLRKGKEKEILSLVGDEKAGPSRLRTSIGSEAISDDDDDDEVDDEDDSDDSDDSHVQLPRTKSQLSLLIQNRREEIGRHDLGPGPQRPPSPGKGKGKEKSKEDELLSMGRRDGVTKAGGVQVPKPQRVSEHDDPGYLSPSSPEPLF